MLTELIFNAITALTLINSPLELPPKTQDSVDIVNALVEPTTNLSGDPKKESNDLSKDSLYSSLIDEKTHTGLEPSNDTPDLAELFRQGQLPIPPKKNPFPLRFRRLYDFSLDALEKYRSWIDEGIDFSVDNDGYCLVVDKAARILDLYEQGALIKSYPVELGYSPIHDKIVQGDCRTPEGIYKLKRFKPKSRFHKALEINYPNEKDREEFERLKKEGKIDPSASIGGYIQIHGKGPESEETSFNWTHGCVALSDKNLDELVSIINPQENLENIRVVIVRYGAKDNYSL